MTWSDLDRQWMQRALELAARGQGMVEPNPMVGCVLVQEGRIVGEGWHRQFGGPHAEVDALQLAGPAAHQASMYVSLEPCCHHGKTPPCVDAILAAGVRRVIVAEQDPFPLVSGGGIARLQQAGVEVAVGLLAEQAKRLNAPFHKLIAMGRPWVIAKWAMSLDGKIATRNGESRWISNETSRAVVHQLRGRVDAILVGRGTVAADNPLLTARPAGARVATRIILDSNGNLSSDSQLVRTIKDAPVLVVTGADVSEETRKRLTTIGCEILATNGPSWTERLPELLDELGRRRMTNLLVEGGATTLGGFFDLDLVDEVHVFVNPRIIGGNFAPGPVAGIGISQVADALAFSDRRFEELDGDLHIWAQRAPR
jgi:diaminohydroxyphosphoribosylaminopyrimidine deaminase/5-amino-6-(5-phosphoribosylamino)uracil reductase